MCEEDLKMKKDQIMFIQKPIYDYKYIEVLF